MSIYSYVQDLQELVLVNPALGYGSQTCMTAQKHAAQSIGKFPWAAIRDLLRKHVTEPPNTNYCNNNNNMTNIELLKLIKYTKLHRHIIHNN